MGYYTQYSLKQLHNSVSKDAIAALIASDECARSALDPEGDTRTAEKWYEHEESLCAWSLKYPTTVFLLHADGEDSDGTWDRYFLGGKLIHTESFTGLRKIDLASLTV